MKIEYPAQIKKEKDGIFFVSFPDIEEAMTQGETIEEAIFNASEVLTLTMEYRLDEEQEIPESSQITGSDIHLISPGAKVGLPFLFVKHGKVNLLPIWPERLKLHGHQSSGWKIRITRQP